MPRFLRFYLLACIVLAFGYLAVHAREPLRLTIGDAWADAAVLSSINDTLFYGWVSKLFGVSDIGTYRLFALGWSGLALWFLFSYVRQLYSAQIALIATTLFSTSMVWMMFADSIYRPPITQAGCFLTLWGVVRALESDQRRHYLAGLGGTFICLVAGSNEWVVLTLGVLFTICVKGVNPRSRWRIVAVCAVGGLLGLLLRSPFIADPSTWQYALDQRVATTLATLLRRYSAMLTPMLWITLGWAVWRVVRARSVKAAIEDGTTWLLVAAVVLAYLPVSRPESAMLRTQMLLPFYAIGSALLIRRLFEDGRRLLRALAVTCCVATPLWGFWLMFSHPRDVLARHDLARANEYLERNDGNTFVMSNLLADGPILAAFGRHSWTALQDQDPANALVKLLAVFETTGTEYVHAVIFTTPGSRFADRSIAQIVRRRMPSVDGWPYLIQDKVADFIAVYDKRVLRTLEVLGAVRVLELGNFDIYRIDRSTALDAVARSLPVVTSIDFETIEVIRYQLLGWGDPMQPAEPRATPSSITGHGRCRNPFAASRKPEPNGCMVVETANGLDVLDVGGVSEAELMVRIERVCDQRLTITLAAPARIDVAFNGAVVLACEDPQWGATSLSMRIPRKHVHPGPNIIRLDDQQDESKTFRPQIKSVAIEPICE